MPAVIAKEKEAYQFWLILHRNFPKTERYGLGRRIDLIFLEILELSFTSAFLPPDPKIILLGKIISRLDILKFFSQLAWENKLIPNEKYLELSQNLEGIGRQIGAWRKGLIDKNKTPAKSVGEKQ
ncbi:MAG: four helix bundle protein [Parcubacteria group bacterium]